MVIHNVVPMEETQFGLNCIIRAFENHQVFIFNEETKNKTQYYFRASDVGNIVGIVNIHTSIANFKSKEMVIRPAVDQKGVLQNTKFLTSTGVYKLLYASKKPKAEKFRDWAADILDDIIFNNCNELKKKLEEKEKENQQEIKRLENIHKEELKKVEDEKNWLNKISKNKVTFSKFSKKTDGVYIGSDSFNQQNFIEKIGKATKNKTRERDLASSSSPDAAYKMVKIYDVFKGLELDTEKYIHTILSPLHINSDSGSTEHFMVHRSFAIKVIDKIIKDQNNTIEIVNNYIDLLDENKYDFSLVEKLLEDNQDKLDKKTVTKTCDKCDQCLNVYKFVFDKEENNYSSTCEACIDNYSNKLSNEILTSQINDKKKCANCKTIYNHDMFYENKNNTKTSWDICKQCHNDKEGVNCKQCSNCKEVLQYQNFRKTAKFKDGHNSKCKDCTSQYQVRVICEYCKMQVLEHNLKNHQMTLSCKTSREPMLKDIPNPCVSSEIIIKTDLVKQVEVIEEYDDETAVRKQCTECEKILLIKNFYIKDAIKQTYRSKCISCLGKKSRELKKKIQEDPMILNKECDKCHEILNKTMFFKDTSNEDDHFISTCISCYNGNIGKKHKHCNQCNKIKSVDNFASDINKIDKKSTLCKECRKGNEKERRAKKLLA